MLNVKMYLMRHNTRGHVHVRKACREWSRSNVLFLNVTEAMLILCYVKNKERAFCY